MDEIITTKSFEEIKQHIKDKDINDCIHVYKSYFSYKESIATLLLICNRLDIFQYYLERNVIDINEINYMGLCRTIFDYICLMSPCFYPLCLQIFYKGFIQWVNVDPYCMIENLFFYQKYNIVKTVDVPKLTNIFTLYFINFMNYSNVQVVFENRLQCIKNILLSAPEYSEDQSKIVQYGIRKYFIFKRFQRHLKTYLIHKIKHKQAFKQVLLELYYRPGSVGFIHAMDEFKTLQLINYGL